MKILSPVFVILIAVALRLLPHPANVAPIAAMALFGGAYIGNKKHAIFLPLLVMFVSDIFLGFHNTMFFVYGSFLLTGLVGVWLRKKKKAKFIIGASLFSSFLFFILTNFGVWFMGTLYPKTVVGLVEAYVMGLPFFRNTLIGDLLYAGLFFGGYAAVKRFYQVRSQKLEVKIQIYKLKIKSVLFYYF
jgi:hypothetical protein